MKASKSYESLVAWRKALGLTQEDAAAILGVKQPTYCRWEQGRTLPTAATLLELARKTGVSVDMLVRKAA